jgi:hypothetical protein
MFELNSQITALKSCVLEDFISFMSICTPAAVVTICGWCVAGFSIGKYSPLESVTFEPGSKLRELEDCAFSDCPSLRSICIPKSVQKMDGSCFSDCGIRHIKGLFN